MASDRIRSPIRLSFRNRTAPVRHPDPMENEFPSPASLPRDDRGGAGHSPVPQALADGVVPPIDPNLRHLQTGHLLVDLRGRTISSGIITVSAQGVLFVITLVSTMTLARLLSPRDFGLVAMVTTVTGFLRVFKDAGLSTATVQKEGITHAQVSTLFWINLGLGGASTLIVAALAPVIAWFYSEPLLVPVTLAIAATFLLNGSTVQHQALLSRQMRFKASALVDIGSVTTGYCTGITMALLGCGYWSLVGLSLAVEASCAVLTWSVCRWRPQLPRRGTEVGPLLSFGANLTGASFISYITRNTDSLLIGRVYGAAAVGLYSRALGLLSRPLQQFLSPIDAVFQPALSRLQNEPERYRRTFLQLYEVMAVAGFVAAGLFLALSYPLTLVLLGPKWERAAPIFAALALVALYAPISAPAYWLFVTQGRGRDTLVSNSVGSVATIGAIFAGLPFGPFGVAIALSTAGLLIRLPILFYLAGRRGAVSAADMWRVFFRHVPIWLVALGTAYLPLTLVPHAPPLARLAIGGSIGSVAVLGFALARRPHREVVLRMVAIVQGLVRPKGPVPSPES